MNAVGKRRQITKPQGNHLGGNQSSLSLLLLANSKLDAKGTIMGGEEVGGKEESEEDETIGREVE